MSDVWKPVSYTIRKGRPEGFKFTIDIDGKSELIKFTNNIYKCPTAEHEVAIAALMHKPQFTQNIQKVDLAAGEAIALAHMQGQRNAAAKGGLTSELAKGLESQIAVADVQAVKDATAALEKENLVVTEVVKPPETGGVSLKIGGS